METVLCLHDFWNLTIFHTKDGAIERSDGSAAGNETKITAACRAVFIIGNGPCKILKTSAVHHGITYRRQFPDCLHRIIDCRGGGEMLHNVSDMHGILIWLNTRYRDDVISELCPYRMLCILSRSKGIDSIFKFRDHHTGGKIIQIAAIVLYGRILWIVEGKRVKGISHP